ncbi:glutathionylspermidine synthase family protein [Sphingomonas sp. VNH70]|uniref:glutathionylspermidine synthase family protein n=1 Tax=Sphingomonas silueang TaxID=3156617 RepID=UPI0032B4822C
MIRTPLTPRPDWRAQVEAEGLIWHGGTAQPYWDESACYRFTAAQIAELEAATAELYRLFVAAGDRIVRDRDLLRLLGLPDAFHHAVIHSWESEPPALNYGRFDLGYDGKGPPKLFEFNCDTPTALLEAAVIQWSWKEAVFPGLDQFNSLHDKLVDRWTALAADLPPRVHFAHVADDSGEDAVTIAYLRDTAERAGIVSVPILIDDLGWDAAVDRFVDTDDRPIDALFKLYPWEWLIDEAFAPQLLHDLTHGGTRWMEPVWKMLWSNKGILPILWDMFPDHPNLLGAAWDPPEDADAVAKPMLAREGANVSIRLGGRVVAEAEGDYGEGDYIYQQYYPLPEPVPGCFPVIGSWVVDGEPAGIGIREDGRITGNTARFVPHVIEG